MREARSINSMTHFYFNSKKNKKQSENWKFLIFITQSFLLRICSMWLNFNSWHYILQFIRAYLKEKSGLILILINIIKVIYNEAISTLWFWVKTSNVFFFFFTLESLLCYVSSIITLKKFYPLPHLGGEFY